MIPKTNTWIANLQNFYPNYGTDYFLLFGKPCIKLQLFPVDNNDVLKKYFVKIVQVYENNEEELSIIGEDYIRLITWTEKLLSKWSNCFRESYNSWSFTSLENAEQFVTLFNLSCKK